MSFSTVKAASSMASPTAAPRREETLCPIDPACTLKKVLGRAQEAFLQVLDGYTLAELITNDTELRGLLLPASA